MTKQVGNGPKPHPQKVPPPPPPPAPRRRCANCGKCPECGR